MKLGRSLAERIPRLEIADGRAPPDRSGDRRRRSRRSTHLDASLERQWIRGAGRRRGRAARSGRATRRAEASRSPPSRRPRRAARVPRSSSTTSRSRPSLPWPRPRAKELAPRGRASGQIEPGGRGRRDRRASRLASRRAPPPEPRFAGELPERSTRAQVRIDAQRVSGRARGFERSPAGSGSAALGVPFEAEAGDDGFDRLRLRAVDLAASCASRPPRPSRERSPAPASSRACTLPPDELALGVRPRGNPTVASRGNRARSGVSGREVHAGRRASRLSGVSRAKAATTAKTALRARAFLGHRALPALVVEARRHRRGASRARERRGTALGARAAGPRRARQVERHAAPSGPAAALAPHRGARRLDRASRALSSARRGDRRARRPPIPASTSATREGFWGGVPFAGTGSFYGGAPAAHRGRRRAHAEAARFGRRRSDAEERGAACASTRTSRSSATSRRSRSKAFAQGIGDRVRAAPRRGAAPAARQSRRHGGSRPLAAGRASPTARASSSAMARSRIS